MPPLRSLDDLDGKERGQKKTDDLRAMTTLGPRTLIYQIGASFTVSYIRSYDLLKLRWCDGVFIRQNFLINVNSSHDENISSGSTLFCTDPNNVKIERASNNR